MTDRGHRVALVALLWLVAAFALLTFDQHGISNDEEVQQVYGRLLLDYYASGFRDQSAFQYLNLRHYGGLFDMATAWLEPRVPISVWDLRHLLTAMFGIAGIAAAAALAGIVGTPRAALLAALLLVLCAPWSGAMFTHTKDIPFGTAMAWALYGIVRIATSLPRPPWRVVAGTGLAIGAALGLRFGALLALGYLGAAVVASIALNARSGPAAVREFGTALPRLLVLALVAFVTMAIFWPWSVTGWDHILQTARSFSHYEFDLLTLLDGRFIKAREVPASYLPHYLLVRLPEVLLAGLALAPLALRSDSLPRREVHLRLGIVAAGALLPIAIAVLTRPALYNGVRHFTFVLPPLAALAALGIDAALRSLSRLRVAGWLLGLVLAALAADNAWQQLRLHPYQYVAYNRLVGGVAGAFDRYELDYWADSMRPALRRLDALHGAEAQARGAPWKVAVCAEPVQAAAMLGPGFVVTRDWIAADFYVSATQNNCDYALEGTVIIEIRRAGVTLAVVKDRRSLTGPVRLPR
jgi:hypothetical protein